MHKLLYAILLSLPLSSMAMLQVESIQAPSDLGEVYLYHNENGFNVVQNGYIKNVPHYNVDSNLKRISPNLLPSLGKIGYVRINQLSDGEFKLDLKGRINGGGFWLAAGTYLGVKVVGYTAILTGTIAVNTALPGVGTVATGMAVGSWAAAMASIEAAATKAAVVALALPTP